ncbi:MAG TPA: FadR/GntR family transcriptional regulator [Gemmatimonadaceae bacterium]|jgi:GntR family transcriptional repressor for pyruvate dehydrogenase complex|nr:FadR/GntR family transcriptional regulator [Gemmatimonadaceae bacterium]
MKNVLKPVTRESLVDRLAGEIRASINSGDYELGERLPTIMEMARRFGVGHPTVREALKKLEAVGAIEIRHGSGVYVTRTQDVLMVASDFGGKVTKKLLLDLIQARSPIEMQSVVLAAKYATTDDFEEMRRLLTTAGENLDNDLVLNSVNMAFHRQIASASGNAVIAQLLDVMQDLFTEEQRLILGIFGSRKRDHEEHVSIFSALEERQEQVAAERMRQHLDGVAAAIERWDPAHHPVA